MLYEYCNAFQIISRNYEAQRYGAEWAGKIQFLRAHVCTYLFDVRSSPWPFLASIFIQYFKISHSQYTTRIHHWFTFLFSSQISYFCATQRYDKNVWVTQYAFLVSQYSASLFTQGERNRNSQRTDRQTQQRHPPWGREGGRSGDESQV